MIRVGISLLMAMIFFGQNSKGQTVPLDSCGIDSNPILTPCEIAYFDKVFLVGTKPRKGFDLRNKKLAFFTCGQNQGNDFLPKDSYFELLKISHQRPRGIFILNQAQKRESGGYDAVIMIDCKAYAEKEILDKLRQQVKED